MILTQPKYLETDLSWKPILSVEPYPANGISSEPVANWSMSSNFISRLPSKIGKHCYINTVRHGKCSIGIKIDL